MKRFSSRNIASVLALILALCSLCSAQVTDPSLDFLTEDESLELEVGYDFSMSQPIIDQIYYETCNITSGFDFVVLSCNQSYEIYDTADLASGSGLTVNYGGADPIKGVHNSLATGESGSVTYIHFDRGINRVTRDEDTNDIIKETLLNFILPLNDTATDAFVLDGLVAIQVNDTEFRFYPIPLIKGTYVNAIPMENITNQANNFTDSWANLLAY